MPIIMRVLSLLGTCGPLLASAFPETAQVQLLEVGNIRAETQVVQNPEEPARPSIPLRFSADIKFETFDTGYLQAGKGFFVQNADQKAMRVESLRPILGMGSLLVNETSLILGNDSYVLDGNATALCRKLPFFGQQRFMDFFSWASDARVSKYLGQRQVAGRACSLWALQSNGSNISLCTEGNAPVQLNVSLAKNNSGGTSYNFSYQFGSLNTESEVSQLLQKPEMCEKLAPACENGRGLAPVPLDAYIFHPGLSARDYNLEDQNVADLAGDAIFICTMRLYQEKRLDHNYTLISRYSLDISPAFGQYAACNGYPDTIPPGPKCFGGDPRLVGREGSFSAGDGESRCAAEYQGGFWYGLPKGGRCASGVSPSKDAWSRGCTWTLKKRLKTIQQDCLLNDRDYLKYCKADILEQKGFGRSMKVLQAAFASEDPSMGGCADVGGPDEAHEIIL